MKAKTGVLEFKKGQTVIKEGEPGKEMFIVEDGEVEILRGEGSEERRLGVLSHGDFFGEMSVIDDLPRGATARALIDCKLLAIDHSTFDQMLRQFPEVAIRMLRRMSARVRDAEAATETARQEAAAAKVKKGAKAPAPAAALPFEAPSQPPAPSPFAAPAAAAEAKGWKLVFFETGAIVPLPDQTDVRVGRYDSVTGARPDVDLTEIDTHKTTSRRHAKIVREEDRVFVMEEIGTANGTYVNGTRIGSGVTVEVKEGDWLQFGGVKTILKFG